jgi:hypothetical protein
MDKRARWEAEEITIKFDIRHLVWVAQDDWEEEIGKTPNEALEALYQLRKEYIEREYDPDNID